MPVEIPFVTTVLRDGPPLRIAFLLRDIESLSITEIAGMLGISGAAVLRARLDLRERLKKYFKRGQSLDLH